MIYTSFNYVSSPKENEVSMNKIEWEMKVGDSIKDHYQYQKHPAHKELTCTYIQPSFRERYADWIKVNP